MFRLALRNLLRNKRRTAITTLAISGGLMMTMTGNNLNHGVYLSMLDTGISTTAGHVVVQGEGWEKDPDPLDHRVLDADAVAAKVRAARPEGRVLQRTFLSGLVTSATNSVGIAVNAVQPELEQEVTDFHTKLVPEQGTWLENGDERGILLGVELAKTLEVAVGKKVVLMGQGKDDVSSRLFRVRGLFRTGSVQVDSFVAVITLDAAQKFLGEPGAASQVSLHLKDPEDTDAAVADVKQALAGSTGLEILGWKEAIEELYEFTRTDRATNNKFMFFIGLIVALGILNTVLMSVMERMREFGVMLALGMTPSRLRRLILTEGLLLGLFASSLGFAGGTAMTSYLVKEGVDYSEMIGETMEMAGVSISTVVHAGWDVRSMAAYTLVAVLLSVAATIYPAWKAGKLQPVEAMRHV